MKIRRVVLSVILIALTLVTGVLAASRAVVNSASRPPTLTIQLFSRTVSFAFTRTNFTGSCGVTFELRMWNFTENMAGRDPGSTWIAFKAFGNINQASLFKSNDVTRTLVNALFGCGPAAALSDAFNKTQALLVQVNAQGYLTWRPVTSTSYTMLSFSGTLTTFAFRANETWTVTTVS